MLLMDTKYPNYVQEIDVSFGFTSDSLGFWDGFWGRKSGLGTGGSDPDTKSPTAKRYHQLLWSRQLPNGDYMELEDGRSRYYLSWEDIYFGSDSITATFRYERNKDFLEMVRKEALNLNFYLC